MCARTDATPTQRCQALGYGGVPIPGGSAGGGSGVVSGIASGSFTYNGVLVPETKVYRRADFVETSADSAVPGGAMDELVSSNLPHT